MGMEYGNKIPDIEGLNPEINDYGTSSQISKLTQYVSNNYESVDVSNVLTDQYWDYTDGVLKTATGGYNAILPIDVIEGEQFLISGQTQFKANLYIIKDIDGVILETFPTSDAALESYKNKDFTIPTGGKTLHVNTFNLATTLNKAHSLIANPLKVGVLGDSLSDRSNGNTSNQWDEWLERIDGFKINNLATSGTGYRRGYDYSGDFYSKASLLDADCDVVVIFGSLNDVQELDGGFSLGSLRSASLGTMYGTINRTIQEVNTRCPDANVIVVTPTPWSSYRPYDDPAENQILYINAMKETANIAGAILVDLFGESGVRPWDGDFKLKYTVKCDGIHLNGLGQKKFIYSRIRNAIYSARI